MPETRSMLQSRNEDCLTLTNLTMIVMERARWMKTPCFEILIFANEFLNCCNRYRNEPWALTRILWTGGQPRRKSIRRWQGLQGITCEFFKRKFFFVNTGQFTLPIIVWILVVNWLLCILLFNKEKVIIGG